LSIFVGPDLAYLTPRIIFRADEIELKLNGNMTIQVIFFAGVPVMRFAGY
jgi:hypothetical protein